VVLLELGLGLVVDALQDLSLLLLFSFLRRHCVPLVQSCESVVFWSRLK
jgi:hypothetical protein